MTGLSFVFELTEFPASSAAGLVCPRGGNRELRRRRGEGARLASEAKTIPGTGEARWLGSIVRCGTKTQIAASHGTCQLSALFGDGASRFSNLANEQQVVLPAEEAPHDSEDHVIASLTPAVRPIVSALDER
jgi:hypothetical protein